MLFSSMIDRFVEASPFCVMARGLMERALSPAGLDAVFEKSAEQQYTKALLFSTTVDLMSTVVCRIRPSVHAAYQAKKADVGVSVRALYDKLASVELKTSAAVVEHTAERLEPIIRQMGGTSPPLLEGYKAKILDGNHLAHSERRMGILRDVAAGPLPGQTLVVYEPETDLVTGVIGCEDGHTQERKLLDQIWPLVHKRDLWIADRNFCTTKFLSGVAARCGVFRRSAACFDAALGTGRPPPQGGQDGQRGVVRTQAVAARRRRKRILRTSNHVGVDDADARRRNGDSRLEQPAVEDSGGEDRGAVPRALEDRASVSKDDAVAAMRDRHAGVSEGGGVWVLRGAGGQQRLGRDQSGIASDAQGRVTRRRSVGLHGGRRTLRHLPRHDDRPAGRGMDETGGVVG